MSNKTCPTDHNVVLMGKEILTSLQYASILPLRFCPSGWDLLCICQRNQRGVQQPCRPDRGQCGIQKHRGLWSLQVLRGKLRMWEDRTSWIQQPSAQMLHRRQAMKDGKHVLDSILQHEMDENHSVSLDMLNLTYRVVLLIEMNVTLELRTI